MLLDGPTLRSLWLRLFPVRAVQISSGAKTSTSETTSATPTASIIRDPLAFYQRSGERSIVRKSVTARTKSSLVDAADHSPEPIRPLMKDHTNT